jgi:hypothetical protein
MESMPDEYYVLEEINLSPGGAKSAWRVIIRPRPGNPGLARPEQCPEGGLGEKSRPGRILLIQPSRVLEKIAARR